MSNQEIQLPRKLTLQLLHLAQSSPDQEICGLIGATPQGLAVSCYPVSNQSSQPSIRFQLDEQQQIAAFKKMREREENLFAIYHSHPSAPAEPSASDIAQASYPEAVHLIISLNTKGVLEIRAFRIDEQHVNELGLSLIEA